MKSAQPKSSVESTHSATPILSKDQKNSFFASKADAPQSFFSPITIQPKLKIGQPGDKYEQEADRVADAVVHTPDTANVQRKFVGEEEEMLQTQPLEEEEETLQAKRESGIQRKCEECDQEENLQTKSKPESNTKSGIASSELSRQLKSKSGNGSRLPEGVQTEMSRKIGVDFSGVNIHTDSAAAELSQQLGARAFTHGKDIYFNRGEYTLGTSEGKHLLAHELTHVVQQKNGSLNSIQRACGRDNDRTVSDFPETYIEHIDVDVTNPASVSLRWAGPNASEQETGPFHATIGNGGGTNNCGDVETSNEPGSNCTPKGSSFTIERQACALGSYPQARNASYFQSSRGIAFHYWPNRPDCPASHGCVRLSMEHSEIIWDNCINENTSDDHGKPATTVAVNGTWSRCGSGE